MILYSIIYLLVIIIYYFLAKYYKLYDKPNSRSSHKFNTLNGGGILFPIAFILPFFIELEYYKYINLIIGATLISIISFVDDIKPISNFKRVSLHSIAVILLLSHLDILSINILYFIISFILITGILNAYNFMDGINGLNGTYSLITLSSLLFINESYNVVPEILIISLIISLIIFLFLNFRNNAIMFSGDIGSISIGYILSFIILMLIIKDHNIKWILLLGVYGLDSVGTIVLRIIRKENIFKAHRTHFYQYLTNYKKINHLLVTSIYCIIQLSFNYILIFKTDYMITVSYFSLILLYVITRIKLEGYKKLFVKYS